MAKKWHIAKRLTQQIRERTDIPAVDYLFNELEANLPDMGGVANTLAKRERHRRALIKLLFDQFESQRLVMCVDPAAEGLLADLARDRAELRVLFVDCHFDDDYLRGHMGRVGLISAGAPAEVAARLIPVVRSDLEHEAERLVEGDYDHLGVIGPHRATEANAAAIAASLGLSPELAHEIAETPHLFAD